MLQRKASPPEGGDVHVCILIRVFSEVHAPGKNDPIYFAPAGANSARLLP